MSRENVEIVKAVFAAWEIRDAQAALDLIDPDIEIDMTRTAFLDGLEARGYAGLQQVIGQWLEAFDSLEWHPEAFIDAGDSVLVWLRLSHMATRAGSVQKGMASASTRSVTGA